MNNNHFSFRAKVNNLEELEIKLCLLEALKKRSEFHIDTYFKTSKGTLKLREGKRQTILINYENKRIYSKKSDEILIYNHKFSNALKNILKFQFEVEKVIIINRKLFSFENIDFQLDSVESLGDFIKVEVHNPEARYTELQLSAQFDFFWEFFEIHPMQLVFKSYYELSSSINENKKNKSNQDSKIHV